MADDPTKDGTDAKIVSFRPRSDGPVSPPPLPPLPPAPRPSVLAAADAPADQEMVPAAFLSEGLPRAGTMGPPLALMMPPPPALPALPDAEATEDGEGEFMPPAPEDPANPTARETLQMCMALVTALGVAAAQGMWHRARHRQALADQARASADKAHAKAAGHQHGGGSRGAGKGGGGGLLTRSHHQAPHRKRRGGGHGSGGGGGRKDPKGPKGPKGSDKGGHGGPGGHGPGAGGKGSHGPGRGSRKAPKTKNGKQPKGGLGTAPCIKNRKPRKPVDGKTDGKMPKAPRATKDGKPRDGKDTPAPKRPRPLRWKAPRKSRPGPGGDKALPPGRKRWTRPAGPGADKQGGKAAATPKAAKGAKGGKGSKRRWKSTTRWLKSWRARHAASTTAARSATDSTAGTSGASGAQQAGQAGRESRKRSTPPPPPRGAEWMRPPPGADRRVKVTVERVDERRQPRQESAVSAMAVAGAPAAGWPALSPAAAASSPAPGPASSTSAPAQSNGAQIGAQMSPLVPAPRSTQCRDADLTIYDVIDADADMAEEIVDGVAEAQSAADGCELLLTKLEALHAKVVELRVPGVLAGMVLRLMEHTATVKAKAEAIAATLPRAAEAISVAGTNAEARHRPLADAVRDAGHIRPAERDYHND
ncbi:hypothetical protein ACFXJ8_39345 [Nonomuraea sp. NPDC059194]|uniref:hypothetical protein n=1 Tax=Nonomuraea sp. NPDC059194 TaxID=3346764 RepID=UPI0036ADD1F6